MQIHFNILFIFSQKVVIQYCNPYTFLEGIEGCVDMDRKLMESRRYLTSYFNKQCIYCVLPIAQYFVAGGAFR